jgi:hypothetical protein
MENHSDYQKGIHAGADAIAREIDREIIEQIEWKGRGLPKGTVKEFFEALETYKGFDMVATCRRINGGLLQISEPDTAND